MANPFGMAEFSIPQLIGLDMQMKNQRLEQMYRQKQQERADVEFGHQKKTWEREEKRDALLAKIYGAQPTAQPSAALANSILPEDNTAPGAPASPPTGAAPGDPAAATTPPVAPTRSDGLKVNQDALNELFAIDPQTAMQVQKWSKEAEKDQLDRIKAHGEVIGAAAFELKRHPPGPKRAAAFEAMVPDLLQRGFSREELAQVDLSDQGVSRYLTMGQSLSDLIEQDRDDRKFNETVRHNKAGEGIAAGNLGLARQREGRITKWGPQPLIGVMPGAAPTGTDDLDY